MGDRIISKRLRRRPLFDRAKLAEVAACEILRKPTMGPTADGSRTGLGWLSPRQRREVASQLRQAHHKLQQFWKNEDALLVSEAGTLLAAALRQLGPLK